MSTINPNHAGEALAKLSTLPFSVPDEPSIFCQLAGPIPGTVITLEEMAFSWCIFEYTEPLFRGRQWMYDNEETGGFPTAMASLMDWLDPPQGQTQASEPRNWTRCVDRVSGMERTRRARYLADGTWHYIDATLSEV